ncbi:MAG: 6-bladed beta-propeller [Gemmatimonadaceae bacterium]
MTYAAELQREKGENAAAPWHACSMACSARISRVVAGLALTVFVTPALLPAQERAKSTATSVWRYDRARTAPKRLVLVAAPVLEIGGPSDSGAVEFSDVRDVLRLGDGRIAVANGGTNEVLVFTAAGAGLRKMGRAGGGPGEFRALAKLFAMGDSLVAADGDGRAQLFDGAGRYVRSLEPLRVPNMRGLRRVGLTREGTALVMGTEGNGRLIGNDTVESIVVLRGRGGSDSLTTLAQLEGRHISRIGRTQGRVLLDAEGSVVANHDRVCFGYSRQYEVSCADLSGRPIYRVVRDVPSRSISDEDKDFVRQVFLDANRDAPPEIQQKMKLAAQEFLFAATAPAFGRLLLSDEGELWVGPYDRALGLSGRLSLLAPKTVQLWSVFAVDGHWVADVTLPARFVPFQVQGSDVIGISLNADDVERVTVLRLRR